MHPLASYSTRTPVSRDELQVSHIITRRQFTAVTHAIVETVTPESVVLVMSLVLIQVFRRLSECTFLSVYSDAKMNIVHYLFGHSFYFGVGLSVLAEAPGFASQG